MSLTKSEDVGKQEDKKGNVYIYIYVCMPGSLCSIAETGTTL